LINPSLIEEKLSFFHNDLFLHILLPPIVFQSALTIDKRAFRRDLFPILTFAIFGTFCSAVLVGYLTHSLSSIGRGTTLPMLDSLLFGSLISSIDPVATLSILSNIGVSQTDTLYTLIFGESLLNDGVAIVFFDTLVTHLKQGAVVNRHTLQKSLMKFLEMTFGSITIGILSGIVCTAYFWALRRKHAAVAEVGIFFCFALIPYYISDGVGYSGIIAIMTMGFFLDYYVLGGSQSEEVQWMDYMGSRYNIGAPGMRCNPIQFLRGLVGAFHGQGHLSARSRRHVGFVAEVISSITETAIFAYLGLFLFNDKNVWDIRLNSIAIFGCLISRGIIVVLFSAIINIMVRIDMEGRLSRALSSLRRVPVDDDDEASSMGSTAHIYLDGKTQQIIFLAGVRGAVSFALVENLPIYDVVRKEGSEFKAELKNMTSCSILFTVFVFGALTHLLIQREREECTTRGSLLVRGPLAHRLLSAPLLSDDERSEADLETLES
jgi:NhaP-type Na+/H+ or K+/H+ antiporter